jgi:hypothetical protein
VAASETIVNTMKVLMAAGLATALGMAGGGMLVARAAGIGASQADLRQVSDPARDEGLSLGFAEASGAFLGAVQVSIRDHSGKEVINTVVDGPWFFAALPPGNYNVQAIFEDRAKQVSDVPLAKDHVTVMIIYWNLHVPPTQMIARAGNLPAIEQEQARS